MSSRSDSSRKALEKQFRKLDVGPADEALEAAFEALSPETPAMGGHQNDQEAEGADVDPMPAVMRKNGKGTPDDGEQQAN